VRIALVAPDIPDYSIEFAQTIAEAADVLLCIPDKYQSLRYPRPKDRLEIKWLPWPRQRELLGSILFMTRLAWQIRRWRPDLIHVLMDRYIWANLLFPFFRTTPILTTVHDVRSHPGDVASGRIPRFFTNGMVTRSDAILIHGDGLRQDATKLWSIRPERCFVFPHVLLWRYRDVADQKKFTRPNDDFFRVLFFGRICEYKGLQYLLKATPLLQKSVSRLKIIVAGSGNDLANCHNLISNLSCIELHDRFISIQETARLFSQADMVVLPYTEASQSGVLMIAMTFGLAVVASDVGELGDTVKLTEMGLVVPPCDEIALAAAISEIACNRRLRRRLSNNATAAAEGTYSRTSLSNRAMSIYDALLQNTMTHMDS
jgi:glycosyltransferase involved in cell wall biosynthesis